MGYDFSFRRRQRRPPISVPRQDLVRRLLRKIKEITHYYIRRLRSLSCCVQFIWYDWNARHWYRRVARTIPPVFDYTPPQELRLTKKVYPFPSFHLVIASTGCTPPRETGRKNYTPRGYSSSYSSVTPPPFWVRYGTISSVRLEGSN